MKKMMRVLAAVLVLTLVLAGAASAEKTVRLSKKNTISKRNDDFNGSVAIKMVNAKNAVAMGDTVTLKAIVKGGKKVQYTLRWEMYENNEWKAIDENMAKAMGFKMANKTLSFPLTDATAPLSFRVAVVTK